MGAAHTNSVFYQEADELLIAIETALLALERSPNDPELIDVLFRALHTIKGSSGMVGLSAISKFTHHLETALDRVRSGKVMVTPALINTVLASKDHIDALLAAAKEGRTPPESLGEPMIAELVRLGASIPAPPASAPGSGMRTNYWIKFRPHRDVFRNGVDPATLLADLRALGTCEIKCLTDQLSPLSELDAASCELGWQIDLTTEADETAIRDVFIFVENDSELVIERGMSEFVTVPPLAAPQLMAAGGEPALEVRPAAVAARGNAAGQSTVRVSSERLDQLVKLVGELVINQARLQQAYALGDGPEMAQPVEAMERLISELRDSVFGIRMMPIGATFSRFQRLVRDLAAQLDKEIVLQTEGAETELDKTVLDQLGDPLVHLIRNSIDHGIEMPAAREAVGKPRQGRVLLTAAHDGGSVVITIQDDGRGLNSAAIRAKAEKQGLIAPGATLSEQETFDLIMRPGFSTAETVTQLSGRGVGMDVVKKTVEGLRGTLQVSSLAGRGTTMRLTLPLTLAIIDGLLVEIRGDRFIVPMSAVTENVELERAERRAHNGRNAVAVRGELVPYVRLRDLFSIDGSEPDIEKVVIVATEGERVGLVVDRVLGSHQTVIQPLSRLYRGIELFSGTTILGDGRVAMILDLPGTVRRAARVATAPPN